MSANIDLTQFYTKSEFARLRGVSQQRVQQYIDAGRLQAVYVLDRWLIPKAAGDAFETLPPGRPRKNQKGGE